MKQYLAAFFFLFLALHLFAQSSLPRSTPEAEGVSSAGIQKFMDAVQKSGLEFHGLMVVRHGKVVAEGWWHPYGPEFKHSLYSVSKSFTATAVGFAVAEGRLKVQDKVISFFPEKLPDTLDEHLSAMTVQHLLSMTAGQEPDPTRKVMIRNDWVKGFLHIPVLHAPGSRFLYNTAATFMLSAIIEKITGQKLIDYLKPRLFEPLGITGADWEESPDGTATGGWGLRLKTEDLAKFGQLFLQGGTWNGKQVLPASWVKEASTMKILQEPTAAQSKRDSSDWLQGYGYQMWRSRNNSFRADGAFGQYILVLPEQDAVIAINSEVQDMQAAMNLVWQYLLPAFHKGKLPENKKSLATLQQTLQSLKVPIHTGRNPAWEKKLAGAKYTLTGGTGQLFGARFTFDQAGLLLELQTDTAQHVLAFGSGSWLPGHTTRRGPSLTGSFLNSLAGLSPFIVRGAYHWEEDTLVLTLRYLESPHTETFRCHFREDSIAMTISNSLNRSAPGVLYRGVLERMESAQKRKSSSDNRYFVIGSYAAIAVKNKSKVKSQNSKTDSLLIDPPQNIKY